MELQERSERFLKSAFLTFTFIAASEEPQIKWLAFDGRNVILKKKIGYCTKCFSPEKTCCVELERCCFGKQFQTKPTVVTFQAHPSSETGEVDRV